MSKLGLVLGLLINAPFCWATDYYFDPTGNNSNAGTSETAPLKDFSALAALKLKGGDRVLLKGGAEFKQTLSLKGLKGADNNPIVIQSYGKGQARIAPPAGNGVELDAVENIRLENINVSGQTCKSQQPQPKLCQSQTDCKRNEGVGIWFRADSGAIKNVTVSKSNIEGFTAKPMDDKKKATGFEGSGILLGGSREPKNSISGINIEDCKVHDNAEAGIRAIGGYPQKTNSNINIRGNEIYHIFGITGLEDHNGNGIFLSSLSGSEIEKNDVHDNGCLNTGGGNIGIWTYHADHIRIANNDSYKNYTGGRVDGGGIDFDWNTTDSVMEYNRTHDNSGFGFNFAQPPGMHSDNLIIRHNTSINDGLNNGYGGIGIWGEVNNSEITDNTVQITKQGKKPQNGGIIISEWTGKNMKISGNQVMTGNDVNHVWVWDSGTGKNMVFEDNNFVSCDGKDANLKVKVGEQTVGNVSDWQKLQQNFTISNGKNVANGSSGCVVKEGSGKAKADPAAAHAN